MKTMNSFIELEKCLIELQKSTFGRRAFLTSLPFLIASCSSQTKHRYREGDNTGQMAALTVEEEKKMTQELLPEMRKDYPLLKHSSLQQYISQLGQKIVQANQLAGNPYDYQFSVVDVKYVNAFALPAGTVMVTAPLIAMADTEAELAGVIGHEIGHVQARHSAERIYQAKKAEKKSMWYALGGGLVGGVVGYGLGKAICSSKDRECLERAAQWGAMAGAGGGLLIQKYAFMAHSREDEMEADRIGFRTTVKAGYSKDHVGDFFSKLLKMEKQSQKGNPQLLASLSDAMSTHPPSQERVNQINQLIKDTPYSSSKVSSEIFQKIKQIAKPYAPKES
jgi:beta-barrel assembly-enhancing protease